MVTNPPFSLFREYVSVLMEHQKKFIIMGNINAVIYKEFFPLIKDGLVWPGASFNKTMEFILPDDYQKWNYRMADGRKVGKVPTIAWYTNLDIKKRREDLILVKKYAGHEDEYPRFDNYPDVINVGFVKDIPCDYGGVMGVPITFLGKYNPDQFEILEGSNRYGILDTWGKNEEIRKAHSHGNNIDGKATYFRIHIRNRHPEQPKEVQQ